jgi:hypothetical protein
MNERERALYRILASISNTDAPLVFKGALITKLILAENGHQLTDRPTNDIDASWVGAPPTMEALVETVNKALEPLADHLRAEARRAYGSNTSAGLRIVNSETGEQVVTMDVDIKPVIGSKIYYYGEMGIRGVLVNSVLSDKICVLSGEHIFRRAKDLIDVFALAHCVAVNTSDIYEAIKVSHRTLGTFEVYQTRRSDLDHAYSKLIGIADKPDFNDVYAYLNKFLLPFIEKDAKNKVWHHDKGTWCDVEEKAEIET